MNVSRDGLGVTAVPEQDELSAEHPPKARHRWANKDIPQPRSHG